MGKNSEKKKIIVKAVHQKGEAAVTRSGDRTHEDTNIHWILSPTPSPLGHPGVLGLGLGKPNWLK